MRTPAIHLEETTGRSRRIEPAPTATAFAGASRKGPAWRAVRVTGGAEFERVFGGSGDLAVAVSHYFQNGGGEAWIVRTKTVRGATDWAAAFRALRPVPGLSLLLLPGQADPAVQALALAFAEERRAFAILDPPARVVDAATVEAWLDGAPGLRSPNAAAYIPRVMLDDGPGKLPKAFANSGAVAGVMVRMEGQRGIWKAPAGTEATISGILGLAAQPSTAEVERLTALGVNTLRAAPAQAPVVWGARTLAGTAEQASDWRYVNVRRTALMIERSVDAGTQWAVFEPNAEPLWAVLRQTVGAFLNELFRNGAFQGASPRQAYFVKCGRDSMTQADIDAGRLIVEIGIAALRPAEFVILRIGQWLGGGEDTHS